jgi:serine/threonine protein kinase
MSEATPLSPLTSAGMVIGTIRYMAPEQIEGKEADARSDLFALGAVFYEMTTGKRPGDKTTGPGFVLVQTPVAVEKLLLAKLAKIKSRQEAPQSIFSGRADIFYPPNFGCLRRKGNNPVKQCLRRSDTPADSLERRFRSHSSASRTNSGLRVFDATMRLMISNT